MSGAFSDSAFGKDTALSSGAFDFATSPTPVVFVGGHFGGKRKKRDEEYRVAKDRLRSQILQAIDGPAELRKAIEPYVRDQQSPWTAPALQIDWERVERDFSRLERELQEAIEDDDDEDWLLLNG